MSEYSRRLSSVLMCQSVSVWQSLALDEHVTCVIGGEGGKRQASSSFEAASVLLCERWGSISVARNLQQSVVRDTQRLHVCADGGRVPAVRVRHAGDGCPDAGKPERVACLGSLFIFTYISNQPASISTLMPMVLTAQSAADSPEQIVRPCRPKGERVCEKSAF